MTMNRPGYKELENRIRESEDGSLDRMNDKAELLENQNTLKTQNFNLIRKSIDLSDVMSQIEDKNFNLMEAQVELEETNSLLSATLESTADGILAVDGQGTIISFNQMFTNMWKIQNSVISAKTEDEFSEFVVDQLKDSEEFLKKVRYLYRYPSKESVDLLLFKDGRVFERHSKPQRIRNKIVGRVWSFHDITNAKIAEEALLESEEKFRNIFENSPVGISLVDTDYRIITSNASLCDMLGYYHFELTGKTFEEITHPEDIDINTSLVEKLFKDEIPSYKLEKRYITKNGETIWGNLTVSLIRDTKRNLLFGLGIVENITERKRAENALIKSEERYSLAQQAANIGSWDWNIITDELDWSDNIEPMFGFIKGKLDKSYTAFLMCVHPDDRKFVAGSVQSALYDNKDYKIEHRIVWPDGSVHWLQESGDVYRDETGSPIRMLGVVADISDRKEAEKKREDAIKLTEKSSRLISVGTLAAGIAHEIRQPLTALKIKIDTLLFTNERGDEFSRKYLGEKLMEVSIQAMRIDEIIDQMRSLVGENTEQKMEQVNINNVINNLLFLLNNQLSQNNITIKLNYCEDFLPVTSNRTQIEQILINLISNSIDVLKTQSSGTRTIDIHTRRKNGIAYVKLCDNGPGIPEEIIDHIFDPFFTTKEPGEGMGLGLAISQNIIQGLGGGITAENNQDGGASFTITLPADSNSDSVTK